MQGKSYREVVMKGITGTLLAVILGAVVSSTLVAEAGTQGAPVAELEKLARAEKGLPTALKPEKGMGEAERAAAAAAFFEAGRICADLQNAYLEPLGKKGVRYLKASLAYKESPLTRVYLGSLHLIQARDASSVITKVREVDDGLKEVDAAVAASPADILIRAIRVESTIELPDMFKRLDSVTADLQILLDAYAANPKTFAAAFTPARLFELKAKELELRGKSSLAQKYRDKAAELNAGDSKKKDASI
jgi:hypothetical protein